MQPRTLSLCKSRAGERSRIWLEGRWLAEAGFAHGQKFHVEWDAHGCVLLPYVVESVGVPKGRVSGSPSRPVIDITGKRVIETFAGFDRIEVALVDVSGAARASQRGLVIRGAR